MSPVIYTFQLSCVRRQTEALARSSGAYSDDVADDAVHCDRGRASSGSGAEPNHGHQEDEEGGRGEAEAEEAEEAEAEAEAEVERNRDDVPSSTSWAARKVPLNVARSRTGCRARTARAGRRGAFAFAVGDPPAAAEASR